MGGEEGFAVVVVSEMDLIGSDVEVGGEDAAETGAAEDVEVAEVIEVEAVCAGEFVRREDVGMSRGGGVKGEDPEVKRLGSCVERLRYSRTRFGWFARIMVCGQRIVRLMAALVQLLT